MKKTLTGLSLAAALGVSAFAAAPAMATELPYFESCKAANAAGYGNFIPGDLNFEGRQDRGTIGVVCEKDGLPRVATTAPAPVATTPAPAPASSYGYHDPRDQAAPDAAYTYADCEDAFAAGVANIPAASADYHDDLDSDQDGIGCEVSGDDAPVPAAIKAKYASASAPTVTAAPAPAPSTEPAPVAQPTAPAEPVPAASSAAVTAPAASSATTEAPQVTVVPEGTPDTGASTGAPAAALAAGGLGLAAMVGAGVVMRRRSA